MEINVDLSEKLAISDIELGIVKENPELIDLDIIPSKEEQIFKHDGEYGYDTVKVAPVTAEADLNIKPENIKKSVNILGVEGTLDANALDNFLRGTLTSAIIPEDVKTIRQYIFYTLSDLKDVKFNNRQSVIGDYAFAQTGITNVDINNSIYPGDLNMYSNVFRECKSLETVNIKGRYVWLGNYTFYSCSKLKEVNINATTRLQFYSAFNSQGMWHFYGCTSLEKVRFTKPSAITNYGRQMFQGCIGLKTVRFDDPYSSFTITLSNVFQGCTQSDLVIYIDMPRATVEGWTNYSSKWGATNATIICNDDVEWVEYEEEKEV